LVLFSTRESVAGCASMTTRDCVRRQDRTWPGLKMMAKRDFVDARFPLPSIIVYGKERRKPKINAGVNLLHFGLRHNPAAFWHIIAESIDSR
jgi:hypothetical protein